MLARFIIYNKNIINWLFFIFNYFLLYLIYRLWTQFTLPLIKTKLSIASIFVSSCLWLPVPVNIPCGQACSSLLPVLPKCNASQKIQPNISLFYGLTFNSPWSSAPSNRPTWEAPHPWAGHTPPPTAMFYTLPRLQRSVSGVTLSPTGQSKDPTRCVRFMQDQSVSSIEQIRCSNSHVDSIVWWA